MNGRQSVFKILGFAGSLRKGSFNRAALRAVAQVLPDGVELEIFDLFGPSSWCYGFNRTGA